jgi:enamine deaminase RidA (YjgF/YER057c/UK114 family)
MRVPKLRSGRVEGRSAGLAARRARNLREERNMSHERRFELLAPRTLSKAVGYSQIGIVEGGRVVFIAGQVALDPSGDVVGVDDFPAQVEQVFRNLDAAVAAAGGSFRDVVKLNTYVLDAAHLGDFRSARDRFIDLERPPVSTAVVVSRLFRPEFLVEVEAVAVV